jgi:hypothetical protein
MNELIWHDRGGHGVDAEVNRGGSFGLSQIFDSTYISCQGAGTPALDLGKNYAHIVAIILP